MDDPYEGSITGFFDGGFSSLWRMYVEMTSDSIAEGKRDYDENNGANDADFIVNYGDTRHANSVFNINEQNQLSRRGQTDLIDTQDGVLGCYRTAEGTYFIRNQNYVDKASLETKKITNEDLAARELFKSIRNYVTPNRQRY